MSREFCDRGFLRRIAFDPAGGDEGGVMRADGAGHERMDRCGKKFRCEA